MEFFDLEISTRNDLNDLEFFVVVLGWFTNKKLRRLPDVLNLKEKKKYI